jgi:two-component sensor histidine kinase
VDSRRPANRVRRWELELPAEASSPRRAREVARSAAVAWGHPEMSLAAGLCASELVTNALVHTRGTGCRLVVWSEEDDRLSIAVHDDSSVLPAKKSPASEAEHGRGLQIVDAVASEWGVATEPRSGKSVWVRLTVDAGEYS